MTDVANPRAFSVAGGEQGTWSVASQRTLSGDPVPAVSHVETMAGAPPAAPPGAAWVFRGVTTNDRYTTAAEKVKLVSLQAPVGRASSTRAALFLLRKSADWWKLAQDERRAILEEQSHHIAIGMRYLPAISRRLLHCRGLGTSEPFDFIGFLDYAPSDAAAFDDMLGQLRGTPEWTFMERDIELRLEKASFG